MLSDDECTFEARDNRRRYRGRRLPELKPCWTDFLDQEQATVPHRIWWFHLLSACLVLPGGEDFG